MIAAIYARKSTDDSERNEEARSTTRQVERATEYARAKGWTVDRATSTYDQAERPHAWARWDQGPISRGTDARRLLVRLGFELSSHPTCGGGRARGVPASVGKITRRRECESEPRRQWPGGR